MDIKRYKTLKFGNLYTNKCGASKKHHRKSRRGGKSRCGCRQVSILDIRLDLAVLLITVVFWTTSNDEVVGRLTS